MTELQPTRPVKRETSAYHRGRPLVIELMPGYLSIREKGKRTAYEIDYARVFDRAVKIEVERQREEKRKAKQNRRTA